MLFLLAKVTQPTAKGAAQKRGSQHSWGDDQKAAMLAPKKWGKKNTNT